MSGHIAVPAQPRTSASDRSVQSELNSFASRLLEQCGGIVEWDEPRDEGTAMLPSKVAQLLGVQETAAIASHQEPGALCVSLASDFLDQSEVVLEALVPRVGAFRIPDHYLKGGDLQAAIEQLFTWHNARVRVRGSEPRQVAYHSWTFFASVKSEDVWESQLNVTINAASKTPVELPDLLSLADLDSCEEPQSVTPTDTFDSAVKQAQAKLLKEASGFFSRTEARLERDRKRLRDYYGALQKETGATKRRSATPPTAEETTARKRAVSLELQRKLAELEERFQMDATLEPITVVCLQATVLAVELSVQRKRAERTHHVYWNPLIKRFESLCCSVCGQGTFSVAFTDDDVAVLCARCHS